MNQNVLIIEDSKAQAKLVAGILDSIDCVPVVAFHGEAAREHYNRAIFDLILLDMILPDASGLQLLKEIKSSINKDTPVVILSGVTDKGNIIDALSLGAHDYIAKPFHQAELVVRLRLHLDYQRITKQLQSTLIEKNKLISIAVELKDPVSELLSSIQVLAEENTTINAGQRHHYISLANSGTTDILKILDKLIEQEKALRAD